MTTLATLGDSFSCGEGVGIRTPLRDTWGALLATALDARLVPLAAAGARVRDVRANQLARAEQASPAVVTMLVGLNDALRSGFCPDAVRLDLHHVVRRLRGRGASVVLCRLHDPTALLPLPDFVGRAVRGRVAHINTVVDELAGPGVVVLDLARLPALTSRQAWAVDRLHPSRAGQYVLATAAASALRESGLTVRPIRSPHVEQPVGAAAEVQWFVRHAMPWLAGHTRQVVVPIAGSVLGLVR